MEIESGMSSIPDIFDNNFMDNQRASKADKAKAVASEFTSIFMNEILQTARKSSLGENSLFDSGQTKMSQKMYYQELAQTIGQSDSFGMSKMIENEITSGGKK